MENKGPKSLLNLLMFEMNLLERRDLSIDWQTFCFERQEVLKPLTVNERRDYKQCWKYLQRKSTRKQRDLCYEVATKH